MDRKILFLAGLYVVLVIIDLLANLLSFIPFIGDLVESGLEIIIETISAAIVGIIIVIAGK